MLSIHRCINTNIVRQNCYWPLPYKNRSLTFSRIKMKIIHSLLLAATTAQGASKGTVVDHINKSKFLKFKKWLYSIKKAKLRSLATFWEWYGMRRSWTLIQITSKKFNVTFNKICEKFNKKITCIPAGPPLAPVPLQSPHGTSIFSLMCFFVPRQASRSEIFTVISYSWKVEIKVFWGFRDMTS